jgi:hypothetical protein
LRKKHHDFFMMLLENHDFLPILTNYGRGTSIVAHSYQRH